ncbi:MAG: hypothetical protein JO316_15650 [Abitibacteriaceae bacterium]|nr:hypothetical protein [Abditibacteriaceae bacterium]
METQSEYWQQAQKMLSLIWKQRDLRAVKDAMDFAIETAKEAAKVPQCVFMTR